MQSTVLMGNTYRRALLRSSLGLVAGALGIVSVLVSGAAVPVAHASPTTFPIKVDSTALVYRYFFIPGVTSDWVDSRTVQMFALAPGEYSYQVASGYYADFTFTVTPQGTISFLNAYSGFLSGQGTDTLVINGLDVTLDARYLSGSGVLLNAPMTNDDWIAFKRVRMVPASWYSVLQGSGVVADFTFSLDANGQWSYNSAYDIASGGFLAGKGTSKLEFYGYPLLVDARASTGTGLTVQTIWGMPFTTTSVEYANLLPAAYFALQVRSGVVSNARFSLSTNGTFTIDGGSLSVLKLDTYNGLKRLSVTAPI